MAKKRATPAVVTRSGAKRSSKSRSNNAAGTKRPASAGNGHGKPAAGEFPTTAPAIATTEKLVPLTRIRDGGAQMREEMRPETVVEYANDMLDGAKFPPVIVFDDGTDLWLGDGFHRVEAKRKTDDKTILAEVRQGTARDAILCGIAANSQHGLRRTAADKRRAVERLLKDPEWARWSDRKIGEAARVDHKTVAAVRRELAGEFPSPAKPNGGEFPTVNGKPSHHASSLIGDLLRNIADDALVAECRRRGLTVEGGDV